MERLIRIATNGIFLAVLALMVVLIATALLGRHSGSLDDLDAISIQKAVDR
jgi:hypothetical protein